LKRVLKKLIDLDQTGFISGRYIGDNIRLIYDMTDLLDYNHSLFEKILKDYHPE
jgi:hypothetical protein